MCICATCVMWVFGGEGTHLPRNLLQGLGFNGINIVKVEMKESLIVTAEKHPRTNTIN